MRFETRPLQELIPAEYNPRKKLEPGDPEYQQIRSSISEFGYADPIVINSDGTIIKGHQRCFIMMDMGITEAEVVVLDISDKSREKALNIALNKITGQWDLEKLKEALSELDLEGYDFTVTGFQHDDLKDLIQQLDIPAEAQDDDFEPDEAAEKIGVPITRAGDIWQLGRHRSGRCRAAYGWQQAGPGYYRPALQCKLWRENRISRSLPGPGRKQNKQHH